MWKAIQRTSDPQESREGAFTGRAETQTSMPSMRQEVRQQSLPENSRHQNSREGRASHMRAVRQRVHHEV